MSSDKAPVIKPIKKLKNIHLNKVSINNVVLYQ